MDSKHVIFVAAENGSLPGGKVGGVGDVINDLPGAVAREGWKTTVVTPSYGRFQDLPGAARFASVEVLFRGNPLTVELFEIAGDVRTVIVHHTLLAPTTPGQVYHDDGAGRPFATDASKFALFSAAVAVWIARLDDAPDVVHLHDWHVAYYLVFRDFSELGKTLRAIRTVFTIHNLAYQGQRPFEHDASSFVAWFPGLEYDPALLGDPHSNTALNPMAYAIRSADAVNTVSPTYAREICMPSEPARGFFGGEGLEDVLADAAADGRLSGILNGCYYSESVGRRPGWLRSLELLRETIEGFMVREPGATVHSLALHNLEQQPKRRPMHVLTSIGRVVSQKMQLFFTQLGDGKTALEHILDRLGRKGVLILLGSGEPRYEHALEEIAGRYTNLVYLRGYSEACGSMLYRLGDVFLMPSSFEPCGISQMQAMRCGQPCIVHGVGGLRDTVEDSVTGFIFDGISPEQQAANFVASVGRAMAMRQEHPNSWAELKKRAAARRFDWSSSARQYIETIYEHNPGRH